jgi:hypothetical protein
LTQRGETYHPKDVFGRREGATAKQKTASLDGEIARRLLFRRMGGDMILAVNLSAHSGGRSTGDSAGPRLTFLFSEGAAMAEYWQPIHTRGQQTISVWSTFNPDFTVDTVTLAQHQADVEQPLP